MKTEFIISNITRWIYELKSKDLNIKRYGTRDIENGKEIFVVLKKDKNKKYK